MKTNNNRYDRDHSWYVSLENRLGQVNSRSFKSQREFNCWYAGILEEDTSVKSDYFPPDIHYQGRDKIRCREITREIMIPRVMTPQLLEIWALAEVDPEAAVVRYRKLKESSHSF